MVIPVERREEYMAALEKASVEGNIEGFGRFVGRGMGGEVCFFAQNLTNGKRFVFLHFKFIRFEDYIVKGTCM